MGVSFSRWPFCLFVRITGQQWPTIGFSTRFSTSKIKSQHGIRYQVLNFVHSRRKGSAHSWYSDDRNLRFDGCSAVYHQLCPQLSSIHKPYYNLQLPLQSNPQSPYSPRYSQKNGCSHVTTTISQHYKQISGKPNSSSRFRVPKGHALLWHLPSWRI